MNRPAPFPRGSTCRTSSAPVVRSRDARSCAETRGRVTAATLACPNARIPAFWARARSDSMRAGVSLSGSCGVPNQMDTVLTSMSSGTIPITRPDLSPWFKRWTATLPANRTGSSVLRGTTYARSTSSTTRVPDATMRGLSLQVYSYGVANVKRRAARMPLTAAGVAGSATWPETVFGWQTPRAGRPRSIAAKRTVTMFIRLPLKQGGTWPSAPYHVVNVR